MAVYTDVSDDALTAFLDEYDLGRLVAFRGIAEGVENSNYSLRTTLGDFILTLYERRVDPADLPWFLGLMRHVAGRDVTCPVPVSGRNGEALRRLCGRHAAITTFLPGVWPRHIRVEHCAALGEALAALHEAGQGYAPERRNGFGPDAWPALLARCGNADARLLGEASAAMQAVLAGWPDALPRGHVHADLFPDNVFFLDGAISGLIDFYFAATDFLAYDLAVCLNAWCFETDVTFNVTKGRALLAGYDRRRALSAAEREALPVLCAGGALRFMLTRLHDWTNTPDDALVRRKDPIPYVRRLRFHQTCRGAADYGWASG